MRSGRNYAGIIHCCNYEQNRSFLRTLGPNLAVAVKLDFVNSATDLLIKFFRNIFPKLKS